MRHATPGCLSTPAPTDRDTVPVYCACVLYRVLFSAFLSRLPAEGVHKFAFAMLRAWMWVPGVRALTKSLLATRSTKSETTVFGVTFPNPVVLAAGFDKEGKGIAALSALGFGAVEIGTVTAQAQPGNPQPRMFRLPADRALINRLGFNNGGADEVVRRVAKPRGCVLGINIGKTKIVSEENALGDYVASAEKLAPYADYLVVNVSSPNTPGLRSLQSVEKLRPLLAGVRDAARRVVPNRVVPLLVKIAPDLADEDVDAVADLALELELEGIIATNTTIARSGLTTPTAVVDAIGPGGLSGAPLKARSLQVLKRLASRVSKKVTLVSVGGIENADDAWQRIRAGASLVQLYTGFVYGGPTTASRIARGLVERAEKDGFARISDAVGKDL